MIKSYVIRKGRFTEAQRKAYLELSDRFIIPVSDKQKDDPCISQEKLDFNAVFKNKNGVTLEIGFGSGLATAIIAQENNERNFLGIEVHKPGIGRLLWEIEKRSLVNIRIIEYDAVFVVQNMIPLKSLDAIHIFFPDPWPKKKHKKRRLIQRPFTDFLAGSLKPGGYLYMVTDWEDYANHALEELNASCELKNAFNDFSPPMIWRPQTRFEQKGIEKDHVIRELYFNKTDNNHASYN